MKRKPGTDLGRDRSGLFVPAHLQASEELRMNNIEGAGAIVKVDAATVIPSDPDFADQLEALARDIEHLERTAIFRIAAGVAKAHELFLNRRDEGGFQGWVETRLGYSRSQAYRLVNVNRWISKVSQSWDTFGTLSPSAIYLLAAPSTPEEVSAGIIERVKAGERLSYAEVNAAIAGAKEGVPAASAQARKNDHALLDGAGGDGQHDGGHGHHVRQVDDPVGEVAGDQVASHGREVGANGTARSNELLEFWQVATAEEKLAVLTHEGVDGLLELFKGDAVLLSKLFDRVIGLQVALASPVVASTSSKKLLTNITGTMHWALGQDDPASGAKALTIIAAKLSANGREPKDICFSFAKNARR